MIDLGAGRFEPRTVKLGMHADGYAEVLGGLRAGEAVVVKANFLIDAESNFKNALSGFGQNHQETIASEQPVSVSRMTYHGEGTIKAIDLAHAMVTLAHGPIESLQWPAMTMDFRFLEPALLQSFKPGQQISFEMAEESAGEFVLVRMEAADGAHSHGRH